MNGTLTVEGIAADALQSAQLLKLHLEIEKLKIDLVETKQGTSWYQMLTKIGPFFTALVAVGGFLWGVFQYAEQQTKNRETAEREFMKPWLESQRDVYMQALSAASVVANTEDPEKRIQSSEKFWQLYQGKMILFETKQVSDAMVNFGECLDGSKKCTKAEMNKRCRALGTAMAISMAATAKMTYKEFVANQFRYGPAESDK